MKGVLICLALALRDEMTELRLDGPRARLAANAALAVGAATLLALLLRLEDPFWAGISAFVCTQPGRSQALRKGAFRIAGTFGGATLGLTLAPLAAYDPAATMLLLYLAGTLAILGSLLSPHGYAWLLGGITAVMVILGALDNPLMAEQVAFYRLAEVVVGTVVAMMMGWLLASPEGQPQSLAPGWRSLFDANWHMLSHATRAGATIALVPLIWRQFELPNLSQMAISIGAVMAVPVLTGLSDRDQATITRRMVERAAGCALGGIVAILFLVMPLTQLFLPWLVTLIAGTWFFMQMQSGRHGLSGLSTQAAVAFILTLVHDWGPPSSLAPAIERLAGMFGAIILLLLINLMMGPPVGAEKSASA